MKKTLVTLLLGTLLGTANTANAQIQDDPVVMEIGDEKIKQSELMKNYLQAMSIDPNATKIQSESEKRNALNEYVQMYANFRLKIKDAYAEQYDTVATFKREYKLYRDEVAAPYLIDSDLLESILLEAYNRNQYAVRASHIMVELDRNASPEDTLKAYKKAMDIYTKATRKNANFTKLAITYSEDPSARDHLSQRTNTNMKGNGGDLGYFTVFDMVFPFEDAVYKMNIGEVCKPIRTNFGYHIIKLYDKVPIYGKTSIQHIWVGSISETDSNRMKSKINDAYMRLKDGEDFNKVVRDCSEDRATIPMNGLIENVPIQRMVPEYVSKISALQVGEFSEPFKTHYGWHIIKVVRKDSIPSFEDMRAFYKQRISRDQRSKQPQNVYVEKMKKKHYFVDHLTTNKEAYNELKSSVTNDVFKETWAMPNLERGTEVAFSINGKNYTVNEVAAYIHNNQKKAVPIPLDVYFQNAYDAFVAKEIIDYCNSRLEEDYPEFYDLVNEYKNGLLIFAYNDSKVWSRAIIDTAGLKEFYTAESVKKDLNNPDHAMYFWKQRADIMTIAITDSSCADAAKVLKVVEKNAFKEGMNKQKMTDLVMKKVRKKKCQQPTPVYVRNVMTEIGDTSIINANEFQKGIYTKKTKNGKGYIVIVVRGIKDPMHKELREARGYYINDYQTYLEAQLIEELRSKYEVTVHQDKIDAIKY
jgi:peptidyl-prolyl cis-trans isomerase SurA